MRRAFLRRRKTWLFALVAMLTIVAAVYYQRSFTAQAESIDTVTLDRGDIEKVVLASGIIKPAVQVSVGAQVSGTSCVSCTCARASGCAKGSC